MKKCFVLILLSIFILPITDCSKNDKYEIEIIIPAGSTEAFVYSEEEIMATGNEITIWSGAGLGDTEVILKPVDETVETGYVAEYLTHGMPVKLDAVKDEWFQVGVAVQNDSDRGPIAVSVEVEGVEVRSEETTESEEQNVSGEDIELYADDFWERVTKVVYYDFDEEIYELSVAEKLKELQQTFTEIEYREIENPWIEGWYLFEIHTKEKIYDLRITGKTISFDGKFYKVNESIAKDVVEEIKAENIVKEWTKQEIAELFKTKTYEDCTLIACASMDDFAYDRVGAVLYTDSKEGYIHVAFMDAEGNMQHCGVEAELLDSPGFTYLGNGEVAFKVCSKEGENYTQKISFSTDNEEVNFVSVAIEDNNAEINLQLKEKYNLKEPEEEQESLKIDVGISVDIDG